MSSNPFQLLNATPGPGAYQPERYQKHTQIKYSMAHKYKDKPSNMNPGPGSYKEKLCLD